MGLIDQIKSANDLGSEKCTVPEWGVEFFLQSMTAGEREIYEERLYRSKGADGKVSLKGLRARVIIACARDEAGQPVFTDQDAAVLQNKSGAVLDRISNRALKISGLVDADELKEIEEN